MLLKQMIELFEILDDIKASGERVAAYFKGINPDVQVEVYPLVGPKGQTDMVKVFIPGTHGKSKGLDTPTLGILGRLGGLGARPERLGFVSDGDGALVALTVAAKLLDMQNKGDTLYGDIFVSTHVCPTAPTKPHTPVPFMASPVEMAQVNKEELSNTDLDAVLSVDTTKGNRVINTRGFAISPTVKEGYILKTSNDLLDIMQNSTGRLPFVFPITTQDITPYGNDIYHLNSIMQPATATDAPVVGVAITTETAVPGCATGASHFPDIEATARFVIEVAKTFGKGECQFYDPAEFAAIKKMYGSMKHLQTFGNKE